MCSETLRKTTTSVLEYPVLGPHFKLRKPSSTTADWTAIFVVFRYCCTGNRRLEKKKNASTHTIIGVKTAGARLLSRNFVFYHI